VNEKAQAALRVMRANAQIALEYARDHPKWRKDRLVIDAIAKRVEEVAETAKTRFPRGLRSDYSEIDWDSIAGMRDRLAHGYGNVDLRILGEVVDKDLPQLVRSIDRVLGTLA
jgi:uncharacterized protein with HEPN domain